MSKKGENKLFPLGFNNFSIMPPIYIIHTEIKEELERKIIDLEKRLESEREKLKHELKHELLEKISNDIYNEIYEKIKQDLKRDLLENNCHEWEEVDK